MKNIIKLALTGIWAALSASGCASIEEPSYKVTIKDGAYEVRDYEPYIIAEVIVDESQEEAGNKAFRHLFRYISGDNTSRTKIDMTAPVSQKAASEKISMTAPVNQEKSENGYAVSFTMPASKTMDNLPKPDDDSITLRKVAARRMAAVKYSGSWRKERYSDHLKKLEAWINKNSLTKTGSPVWARYNSPFTVPILRRNEILIPIRETQEEPGKRAIADQQ